MSRLFTKCPDDGRVLMPLDGYGFHKHFGWGEHRFGMEVSWQFDPA